MKLTEAVNNILTNYPETEPQKNLLYKMKWKGDYSTLTKKQASEIISRNVK